MTDDSSFVLKGNIIYSDAPRSLNLVQNGFLVCTDGVSGGVYNELPSQYQGLQIYDYGGALIMPGLIDLHTHAPQYSFMGLGMDYELMEWLEKNAFPEESKYADLSYAEKAYRIFCSDLQSGFTTRACVFGTIHKESTLLLMNLLEETGLSCMVGKVNMDLNSPEYLREETAQSVRETQNWVFDAVSRFKNTRPIVTPRFLPSCSRELLKALGDICRENQLPLQSHLSENVDEIKFVQSLFPETEGYADAYRSFGLLGGDVPTVMAHCVHLTDTEMKLIKETGTYVAHCPTSNTNLSSGVAPVRTFLDRGISIGLGSDVAGGDSLSIVRVMVETVKASKLRQCLKDNSLKAISIDEAFYMATKGGGSFFGKVGSFEKGYEFDALVIDDSAMESPKPLNLRERFERLIYLSDRADILDKYCSGKQILIKKH